MIKMRNQAGDTIVEVLIAMTIMAMILTGAYVTSTRAQQSNRASLERTEAIRVVESQIDQLKALVNSSAPTPVDSFCLRAGGFKSPVTTATSVANPTGSPFLESLETDKLAYSNGGANDCQQGPSNRYNIAIQKNRDVYQILIRWFRISGGKDQINMYYKVYSE